MADNEQTEDFINLTPENIAVEHLCCIIRSKKQHPGVEAKRKWLSERIGEGHVFRKLNVKGTVFIEYAPLDKAWVPITGDNYYYIYCLWVAGEYAHKGYAKQLMEYCINDAKGNGMSGVCMLGCEKQKAWLSNQSFAEKLGLKAVEATDYGYELLAFSFDGSTPHFTDKAKSGTIKDNELTVYYDMQCPFILQHIEVLKGYCHDNKIPASFIQVKSLEEAKDLPCVFNNWAVFYKGRFQTVNLLDPAQIEKMIDK